MQLSDAPSKLLLAFANGGGKNSIPVPSSGTPGAASYTDGFPPATRTPVSSGGVPPSGLDMNGVLFEVTDPVRWFGAGAGFPYDATFATDSNIGGYPKGARVLRADGSGYWLSLVDNNLTDPDTGGAGWAPDGGARPAASVYASAQQTLAMGSAKVLFDTVEFDSFSLWDATNHRFKALWAGKYRISGSVYLSNAPAQNLATSIFKNGTIAKRCFQFPQVSDVDISYPFDAIISLAVNDYLEAYLEVTEADVLAGIVGSNQAFVFGQIEYLG